MDYIAGEGGGSALTLLLFGMDGHNGFTHIPHLCLQDDEMSEEQAAAELAAEVCGGGGTSRALWKWACLQASERCGGTGGAAGRYEAALYGALGGNVAAVLPVCGSWEDACWAYCRCGSVCGRGRSCWVYCRCGRVCVGGWSEEGS